MAKRKVAEASDVVTSGITITEPKFHTISILITGDSPYCQNRFSHKAMEEMKRKQEAGGTSVKGKKRDPKDFKDCWEQARHVSREGWDGIPAPAFRKAMVSACRVCDFAMTLAKLCVFVEADGFDRIDDTPLVKIIKGTPKYAEHAVRNESGVADIRPRPIFDPGWQAIVRITYDADKFTATDVVNLMRRVGVQVGIGEGRPDSKKSCGMGWGTFAVMSQEASITKQAS